MQKQSFLFPRDSTWLLSDKTINVTCFSGEPYGEYKVEEGQCNTGTTNKITCADVAEFMLKTLESDEYDRKGFAITRL